MRTLCMFLLVTPLFAQDMQDNTSDASVLRARRLAADGMVPRPDEIRIYDFINFHRHNITMPGKEEAVALDVRPLRAEIPDGRGEAAIQIGIATQRPEKRTRPINLGLVIDKSGSMRDGHKMEYVKRAMRSLLRHLTEDDILSIVVYDTEAWVLRAAAPVRDAKAIRVLIDKIEPEGSTNLHGGLMLGYEQVLKNADPKRSNKVVLLSDGLANQGVTDPEKIVTESKACNDKGLDLSTVGIGLSYNDALMNQLARVGRGTYHFLDSAKGIERVFEKEILSLLEKVGRKPEVRIELAAGVALREVHGYEIAQADAGFFVIRLLDLPLGLTQVIPVELVVPGEFDRSKPVAKVRLQYVDARTGREAAVDRSVTLGKLEKGREAAADPDVFKNLTIARLANALRAACEQAHAGRWYAARTLLKGAIEDVETCFGPDVQDKDLKKVLEIAGGILKVLGG